MSLTPASFPAPGFLGLNKQRSQVPMGPEWAIEGRNCVIDSSGRIGARKGWVNQTTSAISGTPNILSLHEYAKADGTVTLIAGTAADMWESSDNGATWTSREGSVAATGGHWQFVNYNDKVVGAQASHPLVVKTSGNFAAIVASSGTVPNNPIAVLAAFGRLWTISADGKTLKWCALLDETKWATADGGGEQDLNYLWTRGTDRGVAIAAFGSTLVVFGSRHIFLFTDGSGSDRGLDPTTMYVGDTIENVGCVARDSVQPIGEGDLMFLSHNGVRSLSRTIQEKASPLNDLTGNIRDYVTAVLIDSGVSTTTMKSVVSPENGFYLLSSVDSNLTLFVDIRSPLQDGTYRVFEWTGFVPQSMCRRRNKDVLFGFAGVVGKYSGYDDNGSSYRFTFRSGFLDLGPESNVARKSLKRIQLIAYAPGDVTAVVKWSWDFRRDFYTYQLAYEGDGQSEYSESNYDTAEYGGVISQRLDSVPGWGSGQYLSLGVEVTIDGAPFAINSMTAYFQTEGLA